MRTLSKEQEELLRDLTRLADGDGSLVEEAFDNAPRDEGRPPSLIAIAAYILEHRGLYDLADQLRSKAGGRATVGTGI